MYRVLLVDDEEIFLEYMTKAIDWNGFQCRISDCCTDGQQALDYIVDHRPDIVFMDISIPNITGIDVCARIREMGLSPVFVIMTAHDEFSFAYQAIKLDIVDYLLKPFTEEELKIALQKALEHNRKAKAQEEVAQTEEPHTTAYDDGKRSADQALIEQIEQYILHNYMRSDLTNDQLARALQFENSYIRRIYKRNTGMTITQRIDAVRIEKAKELLRSGQLLNREIAAKVGYSDQYYFSKRFKQLCGAPPSEFRNRMNTTDPSSFAG